MKKSILTPKWVSEKLPNMSHFDDKGNMSFYLGDQTNANLIELELDNLNISYGTFEFYDDCEVEYFGFEFRIKDIQGNCPTLFRTLKELRINNIINKNSKNKSTKIETNKNLMKNHRESIVWSNNSSSNEHNSNNKIRAESNHDIFFPEFDNKYRCNPFWDYLLAINIALAENVNSDFVEADNKDEIFENYDLLVSPTKPYFVDIEDVKDIETYKNMILFAYLSQFAIFGINLYWLEGENPELTGLNDFLLKECSELYNAYCELSNQYGFDNSVQLCNVDIKSVAKPNNNSVYESGKEESGKVSEHLNELLFYFLLMSMGLGHKIKYENNEFHQIDDILKSFSNLLVSKCNCYIESNGQICWVFKDQENCLESPEAGLIMYLGIFSCFKINLEFLEYHNPELLEINALLLNKFPEVYNAYLTLTNEFKFDGTVKLGYDVMASDEEFNVYLENMKVEKWNGDLAIDDKVVLEEAVSDTILTGSLIEKDVADATPKKVEAKKPVRKSKSTVKKNRSKAKNRSKN